MAEDAGHGDVKGTRGSTERKERMKRLLFEELRKQQDPRVCGNGDIFDQYPFFQQSSSYFYERYMDGKIEKYQTGWVNPSDYEINKLD